MRISDFLRESISPKSTTSSVYLRIDDRPSPQNRTALPELFERLDLPSLLEQDRVKWLGEWGGVSWSTERRSMRLGSNGYQYPMHVDPLENMLTQLTGSKLVVSTTSKYVSEYVCMYVCIHRSYSGLSRLSGCTLHRRLPGSREYVR